MRIGAVAGDAKPFDEVVEEVAGFAEAGLSTAWCTQTFGYDALTLLAALGRQVPGIELGTAVVPVYSRHPQVMAQQAATAQAATDGRLVLGVGLSHPVVVEGLWGLSYDQPYRYMREYLSILVPLLEGDTVTVEGEVLTARTFAPFTRPEVPSVPVVVAALGPAMLRLAGRVAGGTVTWTTGVRTVAEHIVPTITAAAADAGRPAPRVIVSLPVTVTADAPGARERIDQAFAGYPHLPSYRAVLDREGADLMSEISLVGSEAQVRAGLDGLAAAGTTDFNAAIVGNAEERRRTLDALAAYAA